MKKSLFLSALFAVVLSSVGYCQTDENQENLDRESAIKAFAELTENAKKGLQAPNAVTKSGAVEKFSAISEVNVPYTTTTGTTGTVSGCNNAIRVWFELSDGRYVNPRTYYWAPNEVFYIHVESAVPIYVTLYQNFSSNIPAKRVYPDQRFPSSYQMIMPGKGTKLPVAFKMDGNFTPEKMSMVVTRADWEGISTNVPQAPSVAVAVATAGGNEQAVAAAYASTGVVKGAEINNEGALTKFAAINDCGNTQQEYNRDGVKCHRVRYWVSYPRPARPVHYVRYVNNTRNYITVNNTTHINYVNHRACYDRIDDVAFYMFSDNGVGQWNVTLQKCPHNWNWSW